MGHYGGISPVWFSDLETKVSPLRAQQHFAVIGLGKTGISCVQYLTKHQQKISVVEHNPNSESLRVIQQQYPEIDIYVGDLEPEHLKCFDCLVLSPGVPLHQPIFQLAQQQQIPVITDIELFAQEFQGKVIAITGSNGKSTVTSMVGNVLQAAGLPSIVAGNIGTPVLDMLDTPADYAVLELSSYQLELTHTLKPYIATILNISPDHMDRYDCYADYVAAKQRIYQHCECAIINAQDSQTIPENVSLPFVTFSCDTPQAEQYGILSNDQGTLLMKGDEQLMNTAQLKIKGIHNWSNCLVAYAIADALGIDRKITQAVLRDFPGLAHRCQWVAKQQQVDYYNDSKGTNVGATLAAIEGIAHGGKAKIILIAGGQAKDADFSPLLPAVKAACRQVILFGEDKQQIAQALSQYPAIDTVQDLPDAVLMAKKHAHPGDMVLFSPACASFDMFKHFAHRGEVFCQLVKELEP